MKTDYHRLTMEKSKYKVESGIQLLTRLSKKIKIGNFYPNLFQSGIKSGEIIEIFSSRSCSFLLTDMISEAILPAEFGGTGIGVLILNTDGHISLQTLTSTMKSKLCSLQNFDLNEHDLGKVIEDALDNLYILDVFDATQLYTTFQNLENILTKYSSISLCVIDTLTAFYWSEQSFKVTKMDFYLKNLLQVIQKAGQRLELTMIYSRPEYFNSSKDSLENLEACAKAPTAGKVDCRVQLLQNENGIFSANIMTSSNIFRKNFNFANNHIIWL